MNANARARTHTSRCNPTRKCPSSSDDEMHFNVNRIHFASVSGWNNGAYFIYIVSMLNASVPLCHIVHFDGFCFFFSKCLMAATIEFRVVVSCRVFKKKSIAGHTTVSVGSCARGRTYNEHRVLHGTGYTYEHRARNNEMKRATKRDRVSE